MELRDIFDSALISELRLPPVITVELGTRVGEVAEIMRQKRFGSVPVVKDGALVGIFTERDWLKRVLTKDVDFDQPIDGYMTPDPISLHEFDQISRAAELMYEHRFRHIPIIDDNKAPRSMLSVRDMLLHLAECFPESFLTQPPDPKRVSTTEEGG